MSHFQIHRIDDPRLTGQHYRAFWRIDGRTYRVHDWRLVEWLRLSPEHRPRDACRLKGAGWMTLRPIRQTEAVQAECQDQRSAYLSPLPVSSQ
jgi:hypothetical protein